jgi:hypothetical protein
MNERLHLHRPAMTVEELRRELDKYPPEATVEVEDSDGATHIAGTYRSEGEDPPIVFLLVDRI